MTERGIFDSDRFVTSEAVEIELPAASLPMRVLSGLIDLLVIAAVGLLLSRLLPWEQLLQDAALAQIAMILLMVLAMAGIPILLETLTRGRTVGKLILGLRTVREDTGPIGLRHATIRALAGTVELWLTLGSLAILVSMTNERARRVGDFLAGTYVVRDRVRLAPPAPTPAPHELQDWISTADVGALPDALALAVRQLLQRQATMDPAARDRTAAELYAAVLPLVSPPPPPRSAPLGVLAAVRAHCRERDEARLAAGDELRHRLLPKQAYQNSEPASPPADRMAGTPPSAR